MNWRRRLWRTWKRGWKVLGRLWQRWGNDGFITKDYKEGAFSKNQA